jgi:putative tricarboxylic transport membrane protein
MSENSERSAASRKSIEILVALFLLGMGMLVIYDSVRVGIRWADDGPQAGYFPFYVGLILCFAAIWNLVRAMVEAAASDRKKSFVSVSALKLILAMFIPTAIYVALIGWLGLYVSSILYIGVFMIWLGKYSWLKAAAVSVGVTVVSYLLFEVWFKVPLPKGPLEALLGLN